ncbi:ornithine carbamoyltransferase [Malassezia psittaci]|uniref:ornithine carbamoyltransferase n=1 Tax=Malassezia psittaci TaxID=1821823 RepID=A0AAF0F7A4_9BASI|nr:ornithine carbamoyltransferase [Malassezia psittaci]
MNASRNMLRSAVVNGSRVSPLLRNYSTSRTSPRRNLISLADMTIPELDTLLQRASHFKKTYKQHILAGGAIDHSLQDKTIAMIFSKRSTRTRVASESSTALLGGHPMFLAPSDIQLGVNESLYDSALVISSMVDGIMARVGAHEEIELLAKHSKVPVINALSSRYHPTQILADLLTMLESAAGPGAPLPSISVLAGLKLAWVGDSNNILNDILVSFPRLGISVNVAAPEGDAYAPDSIVFDTMRKGLAAEPSGLPQGIVEWTHNPYDAVRDAGYIATDTWISMGDEGSKSQRLKDFQGFQVTEALASKGGAKPDWKFLHCLPRKAEEVDDEVFYGPRSLVFSEAENRKWTIMACFDWLFGDRPL